MKTRFSLLLPLSILATAALGLSAFSTHTIQTARDRGRQEPSAMPGEVIVQLHDSLTADSGIAAALSALKGSLGEGSVSSVRQFMTDKKLYNVRLADNGQVPQALLALRSASSVRFAEPNYRVHAYDDGLPNDPDIVKSWSLKNTGQVDEDKQMGNPGSDINIVPLWKEGFTGSHDVLVAVIDTGIDWKHPDLKANLYTNKGESGSKSDNKKDDDGNGFVDDVHGYNFSNHTPMSQDDHDHGTHCAGVIGAVGDNKVGTAGVNWKVSLLPVKFLDSFGGGSMEGAVEAVNYARLMKANVMSNSWGGGMFSEILQTAVGATMDAGIIFVAAAGNDSFSNDMTPAYPAAFPFENIIAVAATDNRDKLAKFSNFGKKTVHVAAPGVDIYSTVRDGKWDMMSGTSMATPHVAGVAALMLSAQPTLTYSDVKARMMASSDYMPGLRSKVGAKGRLNAYNAIYGIKAPRPIEPKETDWKAQAYALESPHPYGVNQELTYTIKHPGAKYLRIHFEKLEVEAGYDTLDIEDPSGVAMETLSGKYADYTSDYIEGDTAVLRLKSDSIIDDWGFKIDRIEVITEEVVP